MKKDKEAVENIMYKGLFLSLLLFLPLLFSCDRPGTRAPQMPKAEEGGVQTAQVTAMEPWQIKWDNWLKEAKKEGRLVIYATVGGEAREALSRAFKDRYGIDLHVVIGRGSEISRKVFFERRAGLYVTDLYIGGPTTLLTVIKPGAFLAPLEPVLLLPEVLDSKAWWKGELDWLDEERTALAFLAFPSHPMGLNTALVRPENIKSYNNLLDAQWKGKLIMNDPVMSGRGSGFIIVTGLFIMGVDFLRKLAEQKPFITRDERLMVEWLARGKYPIALGTPTDEMLIFIKAGAPIVEHTPREGAQLTSGSGNLAIFEHMPHPYATRIFVNWFLSKEGQTVISKAYGAQSGRTDVTTEHLTPTSIRIPGMKYHIGYDYNYVSKKEEFYKIGKEIFGHLMVER